MIATIVVACISGAIGAALYLALRTDIDPDDYEPVEIEQPLDDRWGEHRAIEDIDR